MKVSSLSRRTALLVGSSLLSLSATLAQAQNFPTKSITLVVPNPPGGLVDTSARLV
ncbi:MAG: hypothetical protein RL655_181, partial [Pseudomonadota bacterium]